MAINLMSSTYEPADSGAPSRLKLEISITEYIPGNTVDAYYLKNDVPHKLGSVTYTPWEPRPPWRDILVVENPPQEVVDDIKKIHFSPGLPSS